MKSKFLDKIFESFKLTEKDKKLVISLTEYDMNEERCDFIIDFLIELKLDKGSLIGFMGYQMYKVLPEKAEEISKSFSKDELVMYDAFKKLKDVRYYSKIEEAEDIRRMLLGLSKDVRVVLIKLAGILYDIKKLSLPLNDADKDFVDNVKEVFAPLAERLGLSQMKSNMEDECFRLQENATYNLLTSELKKHHDENERQIALTRAHLQQILDELGIKGEIAARQKHVSSIFRKIKAQNVTLAQIYDLIAMRVLVDRVEDCYAVFGKIHAIYKPIAGRVKDYISSPKPNGYQTLHTTVIVENQRPMEIQIRTHEMHKNCEFGVAAHWIYKEKRSSSSNLDKKLSWLREVMENAGSLSPEDFVASLKTNLYVGEIFVQSPKGKVLQMPQGSTVLDFAYAIHSDIGNHCTGGRVNNIMRPIFTQLNSGDVVEIITSPTSKGPSRDWLAHVKTSSARSKIKAFFRTELKDENIKIGQSMFEEAAKARGFSSSQLLDEKYTQEVLSKYSMASMDELYASLGCGSLVAAQVVGRLISQYSKDHDLFKKTQTSALKIKTSTDGVIIDGTTGLLVRYAGCCHPVAGDDIIGYISHGSGVTLHRSDCSNLKYLEDERKIAAEWEEKAVADFIVEIKARCQKDFSMVNKITTALTQAKIVLRALSTNSIDDELEVSIIVLVKDKNEVNRVLILLENIKGVHKVKRTN